MDYDDGTLELDLRIASHKDYIRRLIASKDRENFIITNPPPPGFGNFVRTSIEAIDSWMDIYEEEEKKEKKYYQTFLYAILQVMKL